MLKTTAAAFCVPIRSGIFGAALIVITFTSSTLSQSNDTNSRNNPFSPSPPRRPRVEVASNKAVPPPHEIRFLMQNPDPSPSPVEETTVQKPVQPVPRIEPAVAAPTDIYRIGVGDILFINLRNVPQTGGYYTVRPDGAIDFPLAGGNFLVADQTTEDVARTLAAGIRIFNNPQVEVRVREYASHKIIVSGLAERPGEKVMQREAMPLFAIRAEAGVDRAATKALVTRAPGQPRETYQLKDPKTDNVLIYPGQAVEFASDVSAVRSPDGSFYFVSGEVVAPGQRELTAGLTLYQAVTAAGGPKGDPRKATIRRKNAQGLLVGSEHNLRSIRDGKAQDPALLPGDVVEIRN